jgi:hypothetical protein
VHRPPKSDQKIHAKDFASPARLSSLDIPSFTPRHNHVSNLPIRGTKLRALSALLELLFADSGGGGGAEEERDGQTMGLDGDDSCCEPEDLGDCGSD